MLQVNDFGLKVKHAMLDKNYSTTDLCREVTSRSGLYCDTGYLSKLFRGKANSTKLKQVIAEILEIEYAENQS